jgi:hypothetical protein
MLHRTHKPQPLYLSDRELTVADWLGLGVVTVAALGWAIYWVITGNPYPPRL